MKKTMALVITAGILMSNVLPYNYAEGSGRSYGDLMEKIKRASVYPYAKDLRSFTGKEKEKLYVDFNENDRPRFISGPVSGAEIRNQNDVEAYILANRDAYGLSSADFLVTGSEKDTEVGGWHYRLKMTEEGIPVEGSELTIHTDKNNKIYCINGSLDNSVELGLKSIKSPISNNEAIKEAKRILAMTGDMKTAAAELCYYKKVSTWYKAYKVELASADTPQHWLLYLNAQDKALLEKIDLISYYIQPDERTINEVKKSMKPEESASKALGAQADPGVEMGTGKGYLGQVRTFGVKKATTGDKYLMIDNTRPAEITTHGCVNGSGTSMTITSPTLNFMDSSAVDAQYYAASVYDYYKAVHDRNSVDNKNYHLMSAVHYGTKLNNAFWNGLNMMYGDGDGVKFRPFSTDLNVIAHEITHGVTTNTANLVYKDQSGALNEAFSDILSYYVEAYYTGDYKDWDVGEDLFMKGQSAVRNMKQPSLYGQPENIKDYDSSTADYGQVHKNSGIINKAFYNAVTISGDPKKLEKVYYRALTLILTSGATFIDSRNALIQAAEDLYGTNSMEAYSIAKGYSMVGIGSEIPLPTATPEPDTFNVNGFVGADFTYGGNDAGKILEGFTVKLNKGDVTFNTATDQTGHFELTGVKSGDYSVTFSKPCYLERTAALRVENNLIMGSKDSPVLMIPGDLPIEGIQDGSINMKDILALSKLFNSVKGDGKYTESMDFNCDGSINMTDIMAVSRKFNKASKDYPGLDVIIPTQTPAPTRTPTPSPTEKPTPVPLPKWTTGKNYNAGDKVTYKNSNYQCISAHTSNDNWTPPETLNILWKQI